MRTRITPKTDTFHTVVTASKLMVTLSPDKRLKPEILTFLFVKTIAAKKL